MTATVIILSALNLLLLITLWLLYANTSRRYSELLSTMLENNQSYMKAIMAKNLTEMAIADKVDVKGGITEAENDLIPIENADDKLFSKAINYKEPKVATEDEGITWPLV